MLAALGRILQGPPIPIVGGLILLQALAMHVPVLLFGILFAGIVAAFLMLMRPPREAALILALSGIAYAALSYLLANDSSAFLIPLLFLGTPALLAAILRLSGSLSLAILCGFIGAWIGAKVLGLLPLDLGQAWAAALESVRQAALEAGRPEPFGGLSTEWLGLIGTEVVMASLALLSTLLLLLARTWQSTLSETPFFAQEFRATRYGRIADIVFLVYRRRGLVVPGALHAGPGPDFDHGVPVPRNRHRTPPGGPDTLPVGHADSLLYPAAEPTGGTFDRRHARRGRRPARMAPTSGRKQRYFLKSEKQHGSHSA